MQPGTVVIVPTGQAGTVIDSQSVILANGDIWTGSLNQCHEAQDIELETAPMDVERFTDRQKAKAKPKNKTTKWADSEDYSDED